MEPVIAIVSQVRARYLAAFVECLEIFQGEYSTSAAEVLLELQWECAYAFKLHRVDMGSNTSGQFKIQEINPDTFLTFDPFTHTVLPNLDVTLMPFAWNGVEFRINSISSCSGLEGWALRWLDVSDEHEQDANGLQGVIHSVSAPEIVGDHSTFSVDFGSAPVQAVEELFSVIRAMGATTAEIKSSSLRWDAIH